MWSCNRHYQIAAAVAGLCLLVIPVSPAHGDDRATESVLSAEWQMFQQTVQPFLAKHCCECHAEKKSGGVRLDRFTDAVALAKGLPTIEKALEMLRKQAMPPKKRPRPRDDEIAPAVAWIEEVIARLDRQAAAGAARSLVRRLNRAEYNNTIRDLLGVTFQPADDFPADVPGHGFDNMAGTLTVSPVLVEKYLEAAEQVARTAVFGVPRMKPERVAHQPFCVADAFSKNRAVKFDYDETGMSLPSALHVVQRFPVDGEYRLRTILRGVRPAGSAPVELGFWIDGKLVHEAKVEVPTKPSMGRNPGEMNGLWAEFRTKIPAGEHWLSVSVCRMYEGLPAAYKGPNPSSSTAGNYRATDAFFPMYLDVVGPYSQATGPTRESLAKLYPRGFDGDRRDAAVAKSIVTDLVRRAYRRPVTEPEVDDLSKLVALAQENGDSFEEGLCLAIQRMLISPHFLFRVEHRSTAAGDAHRLRLSQYELASRLSYFLWSSMPDDMLLHCAQRQTLHEPEVLEAQVRRMLQDAKAKALLDNFGGQWLRTRALAEHIPDRTRFPAFTDYTRMSMQRETELFFEHILREDRPILDFIDADYTFLNQRLAEFYGIPGIKGHEFRKVDLTGTARGGVLTQASVLTVSSYANRTSPVIRGKWILENILNAPPAPPPPDAPSLDEQAVGKSMSLREQFEKHRSNATCASCHARLDPLGFALEHFDAIGAWRDKDGTFPIDTSGTLPDGRQFKDHVELKALLKSDPSAFVECLAEKMLMYALGRGLNRNDRKAVRAIADKVAREDYRFSSLVLGIVQSVPFQLQSASRDVP